MSVIKTEAWIVHDDSTLLLLLTPWPGAGDPGSLPSAARCARRGRPTDQTEPPDRSPSAKDDDPWSLDPLSPLP